MPAMEHLRNRMMLHVSVPVLSEKMYFTCKMHATSPHSLTHVTNPLPLRANHNIYNMVTPETTATKLIQLENQLN